MTTARAEAVPLGLPAPVRAVLAALAPFALALLLGALVLAATGRQPVEVYALMLREAVGGTARIAATLTAATPLLFTGLATGLAFRAGVFNIGVEGSFLLGGLAAAVLAVALPGLPGPVVIVAALAASAAAGALLAWPPGWLRARFGVDEVVTTLMLNFVAANLASWLVAAFFLAPGVANSSTALIPAGRVLPRLLPPSSLSLGLVLGLALMAAVTPWNRSTALGYEFRVAGLAPAFAAASGVRLGRVVLTAMLASGLVGGLGGGVHALGLVHRYVEGFSPGYGFTGIAVALLGRNHPLGMTLAALLFGALASAGATLQLFSDVPLDIVEVLQGTVMIFAVVQLFRVRGTRGSA